MSEIKTIKERIIERNITNEDGDFYGVCGDLTREEAFKVILEDLEEYGIVDDISFTAEDLFEVNFKRTTNCRRPEYEDWIWWGEPVDECDVDDLGKGWGFDPWK